MMKRTKDLTTLNQNSINSKKIDKPILILFLILVLGVVCLIISFNNVALQKIISFINVPSIRDWFIMTVCLILGICAIIKILGLILNKKIIPNFWTALSFALIIFSISLTIFLASELITNNFNETTKFTLSNNDENINIKVDVNCNSSYPELVREGIMMCNFRITKNERADVKQLIFSDTSVDLNRQNPITMDFGNTNNLDYSIQLPDYGIYYYKLNFIFEKDDIVYDTRNWNLGAKNRSKIFNLKSEQAIADEQNQKRNFIYSLTFFMLSLSIVTIFSGIKALRDLWNNYKGE